MMQAGIHRNIKIVAFILIQLSALFGIAQVPGLINYQGIVRDNNGVAISNQAIALKFEVLQGSANGSVVYTDNQASGVITNAYGLFTTQIGKTSGFGQVNWQQGVSYYLKIWVDPAGGTNLVALGNPQQITSVPYAFHAQTVPATYSNNILSIGNRTFDITPSITSVPNTSITLSGLGTITSAGTNSFDINIPAPTFTNTGQQIITGTYPNFTVNTPTVPASSVPTIAITNNAATTSTVQSSGNSFSINVPPPSFTNTGQNIITGTYPNFTVNTPTVPASSVPTIGISNNAAAGSSVTSSGNSFSINVPPPTFTNAGPATITGAYPNYTINSPTGTTYTNGTGISITSGSVINNTSPNITPTVAVTTTASGAASVSSLGSSFNINVPPPAFTNAGPATITGTYPNYTINSPVATTYTNGTGISITSGSVITNTSPNITPTIAVTATAASGPSVTGTGSSFNINIPPTTAWSLLGNAGTTVSNFIGTTDASELIFKINNQKAGRIENTSQSVYFGYLAGPNSNTSTANTGIGYNALNANTSGTGNTGIGYLALQVNTSGIWNTAIGGASQWGNTTGSSNVALGYQSLRNNSIGSGNIAIGRDAMLFNNDATGDNVVIGSFAMVTSTLGSRNVMIGREAGGLNANGSTNVFLGYRAGYNELGSNKLYIANNNTIAPLVYGDFTNNYLGIGTTAANAPLQFSQGITGRKIVLWEGANNDHQVYGFGLNSNILRYQVDASVASHVFYAGINSTTSLELMRITGTGRVGVGTAAPTATFHVTGTTRLVDGTQGLGKVLTSDALGNATWAAIPGWGTSGNAGTSPASNFIGTTDNQDLVFRTNNAEVFRAKTSGDITLPEGATRVLSVGQRTANNSGNSFQLKAGNAGTGAFAVDGGDLILEGGDGYNISVNAFIGGNVFIRPGKNVYASSIYNSGEIIFQNVNASNAYYEMARFNGSGFFGLGTNAPTATLHVNGSTRLVDGTEGTGKVLTSDAVGNASWQVVSSVSKTRSVVVDPGMVDLTVSAVPPTKTYIGGWQRPCINYADGALTQIVSNIPVPRDWNGSTSMTITVLYSSPSTTGNFYVTIGNSNVGLNTNAASPTSGSTFAVPASTTAEGLLEFSNVITTSSTDKMIEIYIRRDGANGLDTSTSPMHMWGYRLDYKD